MRIFTATGIFHPESGGPATYLQTVLPALQARGHHIEVLTFGEPTDHTYPYPVHRVSRRAPYPIRQMQYYRAAQHHPHDVAFIHSLGVPLPPSVGPRVAKIVGDQAWERAVNRGWVPPDEDIDTFQTKHYRHPLLRLTRHIRRQRAQSFDHIIVPSQYLKRMVIGWSVPADRISVIYNAIAPTTIEHSPEEAHRILDLPASPVLLSVGRLTAWKNMDVVIKAVAQLPDVTLLVAGDGPEMPALHALVTQLDVTDRIHLMGRIPHDRMALYYRAADYVVLYSSYEGLSHVLLESLTAGTPLIASAKGGNVEVVDEGTNGFLVPYHAEDPAALVEAISHALQTHLTADLDERFTWETMFTQTCTLLERIGGST